MVDLTPEQVKAIADAVVLQLGPASPEPIETDEDTYFDEETQKVVYTEEAIKAADEAQMECLKALPKGGVAYKGRSGTQIVNHSQESLEAIDNWKKRKL